MTARAGLQIGSNSLAVTGNLEGWKTVSGTGTRPAITCLHILPWPSELWPPERFAAITTVLAVAVGGKGAIGGEWGRRGRGKGGEH